MLDDTCGGSAAGVAPRFTDLRERGGHRLLAPVERPRAVDTRCPSRHRARCLSARRHRQSAEDHRAVPVEGRRDRRRRRGHRRSRCAAWSRPVRPCGKRRAKDALITTVVVLASADADTHREPSVGEHVDGRHLLCDGDRVVGGQDHDRRPEPHPFGQRGSRRELHGDVVAGVGDSLRNGEARPRPVIDAPAPGEHISGCAGALVGSVIERSTSREGMVPSR